MINLGISQGFHDAGLALVDSNGNILHASHSERYSRLKNDRFLHDQQFHDCSIDSFASIQVNYYERTWLTNLRRLYAGQQAVSIRPLLSKLKHWNLPPHLRKWGHHHSHAAAAFQTSKFDHAAVVIVDAIGEWDTASIWHAAYDSNGVARYRKLWSRKYPHSIGLFYTAMTQRVGLRPMEDEYVLMGMAPYGNASVCLASMLEEFIDSSDEIKFKRNLHAGCDGWALSYSNENIAAAAQEITEQLLYNIHKKAAQLTQEGDVCVGGGVALNCKFNARLDEIWQKVWICPNPGDAGSALGAAALGYGKKLHWKDSFLGHLIPGDLDVNSVIDALIKDQIVGVANGAAEWGPRALGNRSLLADPRPLDIKDRVNELKHRQKYRPFAPAVLEEHANEYFNLSQAYDYHYMQYAVETKDPYPYSSTCHIDNSARVQVVSKDNSNMRKILEAWYDKTKCPVLLNTSLNIRGEPIVNNKYHSERFSKEYGVTVVN